MRDIIEIYSKLVEILPNNWNIPIPIISIVGAQSCGKTSILEKIAGFPFLPKGSQLATKCPIKIHILNPKNNKKDNEIYLNNEKKDKENIEQEIKILMDNLTGGKKNIVNKEINIHIYKKNVIELVLVDLPGLIKIPLEGQPKDIEDQVNNLVLDYIKKDSTIILAVQSMNNDIANSDALKLIKKVDSNYERTIGIMSKLDLYDVNINDMDSIFNNKIVNLNKGFYGICCNFSSKYKSEEDFFKKQIYFEKFKDNLGIKNLIIQLNTFLVDKFKKNIPLISSVIFEKIEEHKDLIKSLGYNLNKNDEENCNFYILELIYKYSEKLKKQLNVSSLKKNKEILNSGARIGIIFEKFLIDHIKNINILDKLSNEKILLTIRNCKGFKTNLFVSQTAFELIAKNEIKKLQDPCINCLNLVYKELLNLFKEVYLPEFERFKNFKLKLDEVILIMLKNLLEPVNNWMKEFFDIESGFINMHHPDFINWSKEAFWKEKDHLYEENPKNDEINNSNEISNEEGDEDETHFKLNLPSKRELNEINIIKKMLVCYFEVVKKNICDYTQKIIITKFINYSLNICEKELISHIYKKNNLTLLLQEDANIEFKRNKLNEDYDILNECQNIINKYINYSKN